MDYATEIAIGIVCGAAIIGVVIYCIYIVKQASKGKKYLTEHFEEVKILSKNYTNIAMNYIEKLKAIDALLFTVSYNTTRNLIVSHYWQQKPNLLLSYIYQYDGFVRQKDKVNLILPKEEVAKKLTEDTISELKNAILADNSWGDKYTLPSLIYFIIRNNVIETFAWQSNNIIPNGRDNYNREHQKEQDEKKHNEQIRNDYFAKNLNKVQEWDNEWENYKREQKEKERLERERIQKEKEVQEQNSISHLTENEPKLTKKYSSMVFNFIEKLTEKYPYIFLRMFNNMETLQSSILVKPYQSSSQLLTKKILYDGLEFTESDNAVHNKKIQELTDFFIKGLKKRILENDDYNDEFSFPALLYFIVRNNVIKYYRNEYMKTYGYESLEEFCCHIANPFEQDKTNIKVLDDALNISRFMSNNAITEFIYYYIYENDIKLPFVKTYKDIVLDMKKIFERKQKEKLEEDLFGKPKKKFTVDNTAPTTVSIIDRIDKMSGEQFEIFMEQFFTRKGFKVTRTPLSGDYGVDIIIENDFGKIGVQAKCYSNKVSLSAVQEVIGGLRHYNLSSGMVVTNNYFQASAIRLAADNNIILWDRNKLIEQLEE